MAAADIVEIEGLSFGSPGARNVLSGINAITALLVAACELSIIAV